MVFVDEPSNDPREALGHVLRGRAKIPAELQSCDPVHRHVIKLERLGVSRKPEAQGERPSH